MTASALLVVILRCALGMILVAAGAAKSVAPRDFSRTLLELTGGWANPQATFGVGRAFAGAELSVGVLALGGVFPAAVDLAMLSCTGVFAVAALYGHLTHPNAECRCFGSLTSSRFDRASVVRAICLATVAGLVVAEDRLGFANWAQPSALPAALTIVSALLFALACAAASRAIDEAGLTRRRRA